MATDTFSIEANSSSVATQIVHAGDGPTLITNTSLTAIVYIGNANTIQVSDGTGIAGINPNGSVVVDGTRDFFAVTASATPVIVETIAGGIATFLGITQGLGSLAIPSIHSPNYLPGTSGWSINQNGSAELNNLTLRGNQVFPNGFISNGDGTLTNEPGFFLYSGTPAAGNLIISITGSNTGNDKFHNNFLPNFTQYFNNPTASFCVNLNAITSQLQWFSMTVQPNAVFTLTNSQLGAASNTVPGIGAVDSGIMIQDLIFLFTNNTAGNLALYSDVNGILNIWANSGDGNVYKAGHSDNHVAVSVPINAIGFTAILTQFVGGGGRYKLRAQISYSTTTTAAGTPTFGWGHGSTCTINLWTSKAAVWNNTGLTVASGQFTHAAGFAADISGPVMSANSRWVYEIEGEISIGVGGTLILSAATSSTADPFVIDTGSFVTLEPI